MTALGSGDEKSSTDAGKSGERGTRLWPLVVLVVALLPSLSILSAVVLVIVTNNLDPAFALGVSDTFINGLIVAISGTLSGLSGGALAKIRGWKLLIPPVAAVFIGLAILGAFATFGLGAEIDNDFGGLATIWIGQATAIVLATRLAGTMLVGAVGVLVFAGIGSAAAIAAIPESPAEVLLILEDHTYDDPPGGECSGADELSEVVEGSRILLLGLPENSGRPAEVASVVLPPGREGEGGCVFELGNPLGGTAADYENIDFVPESDPGVAYSVSLESRRVVITMGLDE